MQPHCSLTSPYSLPSSPPRPLLSVPMVSKVCFILFFLILDQPSPPTHSSPHPNLMPLQTSGLPLPFLRRVMFSYAGLMGCTSQAHCLTQTPCSLP